MAGLIEVVKPGLDTCVQDYPGRIGHYAQGFPPSGPMDSWSFRLANLLVGNPAGAAALECQFIGPTLTFHTDSVIAVCGCDMAAKLDDTPAPLWRSVAATAGQTLEMSFAATGARSYVAFAGGIDVPEFMGSRSTFKKALVGGLGGTSLVAGATFSLGPADSRAGRTVPEDRRPPLPTDKRWTIEVVAGPNDDWIDAAGHRRFLESDWILSSKSDRTGFRLEGPEWTFTRKAREKPPEHGSDPSNIIDYGYPIGGINLGGQTPIILVKDALNMGGFICPYTVPMAAFWKLGQSRPGDSYRFKSIGVEEAQESRRRLDVLCSNDSIV
jgi:urea carboxylase